MENGLVYTKQCEIHHTVEIKSRPYDHPTDE
jgi:hypothetical protein